MGLGLGPCWVTHSAANGHRGHEWGKHAVRQLIVGRGKANKVRRPKKRPSQCDSMPGVLTAIIPFAPRWSAVRILRQGPYRAYHLITPAHPAMLRTGDSSIWHFSSGQGARELPRRKAETKLEGVLA